MWGEASGAYVFNSCSSCWLPKTSYSNQTSQPQSVFLAMLLLSSLVFFLRLFAIFKSDLFFNMPQGSIITVQIRIKRARVFLKNRKQLFLNFMLVTWNFLFDTAAATCHCCFPHLLYDSDPSMSASINDLVL